MTVKELEDCGSIREVKINRKQNGHSICRVRLLISDNGGLSKLKKTIGAKVCVENEERIFMRGTIREISCGTAYSDSDAVVKIVSFSDKTDMQKKKRIYQNVRKRYKNVFEVLDSLDGLFQIMDIGLSDLEEPLLLFQDGQTDFEFALHLAGMHGCSLFVNDTDSKCTVNICRGYVAGSRAELKEDKIIRQHFMMDGQQEILRIMTRQNLEWGHIAEYGNGKYAVINEEIHYKNGAIHYAYDLRKLAEEGRERKEGKEAAYAAGLLGRARVADSQDPDGLGRIQVEFLDVEDCQKDNRMWIPYIPLLTEKDAGIVFLPDADEVVYVFVQDGRGYACGCIREKPLKEGQRDAGKRTMFLRDKQITVSAEAVELEGFSYSLRMTEDSVVLSNEGCSITMGKDNMFFQCGNTKVNLSKDTVQLLADNRAEIKADRVNLDGSSRISAKTSSFNVG